MYIIILKMVIGEKKLSSRVFESRGVPAINFVRCWLKCTEFNFPFQKAEKYRM